VAVIVAVVVEVTAVVVSTKVAVVVPAGTVTPAGTVAEVLSLASVTVIPPVGAAVFKVTVPVEELPPVTDAGFSETEDSAGAGAIVSDAVLLTLL
jgi:hypothetical protein